MNFPEDYKRFIEDNPELKYCRNLKENDDVVFTSDQLLEMMNRLDTYDDFTKQMNIEFIKSCVDSYVSKQHEIDLIGVTPKFVEELRTWLRHLEDEIKDTKTKSQSEEDENGPIHQDLIHLYFYRKHVREIVKYL